MHMHKNKEESIEIYKFVKRTWMGIYHIATTDLKEDGKWCNHCTNQEVYDLELAKGNPNAGTSLNCVYKYQWNENFQSGIDI